MGGQVFTTRDRLGPPLRLGRLLGEGAAGKVYVVQGRIGQAAKLYHSQKTRRDAEAKIDAMLARMPQLPPVEHEGKRYPQLAWPMGKLYDSAGAFAGFLMPEIDYGRSSSLVNMLQQSSRRAEGISDYYGYRLLLARNFASVIAELHRAGHYMIDMKPANLRFYPAVSWIAVVDTDGFSIAGETRRIPADQVSDEYIAPEGLQKKPCELGEAQDRFALAAIIFQLLNNGLHPFSGAAQDGQPSDLQGRIQAGLYAYGLQPSDGAVPGRASIHKSFRRSTRQLFDRAFMGADTRPSAAEWRDHLDGLLGMLIPCAAKPEEHAHFGGGCGFCALEARLMRLAFEKAKRRSETRRAIPLGPPANPSRSVPLAPLPSGRSPQRPPLRQGYSTAGPGRARRNGQNGGRFLFLLAAGLLTSGLVAAGFYLDPSQIAANARPSFAQNTDAEPQATNASFAVPAVLDRTGHSVSSPSRRLAVQGKATSTNGTRRQSGSAQGRDTATPSGAVPVAIGPGYREGAADGSGLFERAKLDASSPDEMADGRCALAIRQRSCLDRVAKARLSTGN